MAVTAILSKLIAWLSANWVTLLKLIAVGTLAGVGITTVWRYIEATGKPEVQQVTTSVAALVQAMMPLLVYMMLFQMMSMFTSMVREMAPRRE